MKNSYLIFACFILLASFAKAQDYQILNYDAENGLHNNFTKAIAQDSLGFIWIATDDGLSRFDGINFKVFNQGLPSTYVKALVVLKNKRLIAVTDIGAVEIVSKIDTAYFVTFIKGSDKPSKSEPYRTKDIFETSEGTLWVLSDDAVYSYKNKKIKYYFSDKKNNTSSLYHSFSMVEDSSQNLFLFSQQGYVYKYNSGSDKFDEIKNVGRLPSINGAVSTQFGEILVATDNGIYAIKYDKSFHFTATEFMEGTNFSCIGMDPNHQIFASSRVDGLFNLYKHKQSYKFEIIPNLPIKFLNSVFFDKENNVWFSTDEGIILLNPVFFASNIKGLKQIYINDIKKDSLNNIYISHGNSVYKLYNENNRLKANIIMENTHGINSQIVPIGNKVLVSSSGKLECIDDGKILRIPNVQNNGDIFLLQKDKNKNIWLCTSEIENLYKLTPNYEFIKYNSKFGNLTKRIISFAQDSNGTAYFGAATDTAYLFKYDNNKDIFKNISAPIKFEHNKNLDVHDLAISGKSIYLATSDGLFLFENGRISQFLIKGFENKNVKFVETDKSNNLWIGYDKGVVKYNKSQVILFDKKDGLPTKTVVYRSILIDNYNNVIIGTNEGLAYSFKNNQYYPTPSPIITSIQIDKVNSTINSSIFDGSYATISFLSLSYPGKDIKYQTKILELDTNWSDETHSNDLFIPKLKKGKYTIYIRALQHGNYTWSQPTVYTFIVLPNWYNTWWAYTIYLITLTIFISMVVKLNTHRLRKEKELLESVVKQRTMELVLRNEEIQSQNHEIHAQNDEMLVQKKEIELQATKLQVQNTKLQELGEFKQGLTSMIVHDLKNPLNLILNVPKSLSVNEQNTMMEQSGKQLLNMVLNMLDVDKYEEISMNLNLEEKQFLLIAINAIKQVQFLCERKEISIKNEIDQGLFVKVEEEVAERILVNLLTNAIKYSPVNGQINLISKPISETFVCIEIHDSGEGIPKDKIQLVFQKFGQIVAKKSGGVRSTGLGLTFCKLAVEAHGGEINVNSEVGKGTTFWFTLQTGTSKNSPIEIVEQEIEIKDEPILFTEQEKALLEPIIKQLNVFSIYETSDIEEVIAELKAGEAENIQKWIARIKACLITLNQAQYLELLKLNN